MKPVYKTILPAVLLLFACGGKNSVPLRELTSTEYYEVARGYLDRESYEKAISELKIVIRRFPDSEIVDDALLSLAQAYYAVKDYPQTIYEIKRLQRDYPKSPLVEDGQYYLALSYLRQSRSSQLDQEETGYAIEEFKLYLADYPAGKYITEVKQGLAECNDKLSKKVYETARLYYRLKDYKASIIYCNEILDHYSDTSWKDKTLELLGLCELMLRR